MTNKGRDLTTGVERGTRPNATRRAEAAPRPSRRAAADRGASPSSRTGHGGARGVIRRRRRRGPPSPSLSVSPSDSLLPCGAE